ncbi:hypothetical protein AVEN_187496-1 [Araneus ventricosus]|uniref:Transposase Tc1-like domain-containing protein n=1 Tax=Araneus ventricosus TaxID=182803 RepID=A0A4Y2BTQ0_ARAVE|nr:hypothetical protein AVEN_187496-1 [Araneus ventricosus]
MGFSSRRPSRVPLVSQKNRKRRLLWAQERRNWLLQDWKKVAWSDESRFLFHHTAAGSEYGANSTNSWTPPAKRQLFRLVAGELWCVECFPEIHWVP